MDDNEKPSHLNAIISASIVTLAAFSIGAGVGWSSPAGAILENKLHVSSSDAGWITSLIILGAMCGLIPTGFVIDFIGCKMTMLITSPFFVVGWLCVAFAQGAVIQSCVGRFMTGLCCGFYSIAAPIFNAEISHASIRGSLGVLYNLQFTFGMLAAYIIGFTDDLRVMSLICALFPIILFVLLLVYIKETPIRHIAKKEDELAMKSLMFYRGKQYKYLDQEMKEMREYTNDLLKLKENKQGSFFKKFFTRYTLHAFGIGVGLQLIQQLAAINMIAYNVEKIFSKTQLSMSARIPPVIFGAFMVVANSITTVIIDKFQRRTLLGISLLATGICHVIIGSCFILEDSTGGKWHDIWPWVLVVFICLFTLAFAPGLGAMPLVMTAEMFPPEVKGPAVSMVILCNGLFAFFSVKFFTPMLDLIGMPGLFFICAVACFINILFVYFVCIETKGRTLEEIQRILGHGSD